MSKIQWKGGALLAPVPACMVSCGTEQKPNIITIAWTGIINTHPPKTYISVRPSRHSYPIIKESGEFVINLTTSALVRHADFCGVHTGAKVDKFARCGLHTESASEVSCPLIAESPLALECRVTEIIPLGTHDMILADIVAIDVDESLVDEAGKLHLDRADLAAYAHGEYFALGKKLGSFGYSVRKKKNNKKRR
ncbi:MAG: flavin reductase family protein [Clostridia bacterium]|nr:flavin reductase family protein [Clostridia bacterium]